MVNFSSAIESVERTIYVVDDDPSIRKAFGRVGQLIHCSVETFESAEDLLAFEGTIARRSVFVVDYRLPGMNGAQLCARLREMGSDVPVLFITAHDNTTTRASLEAIHADSVFIKPLDFKSLIAAIEDLLEEEGPRDPRGENREGR